MLKSMRGNKFRGYRRRLLGALAALETNCWVSKYADGGAKRLAAFFARLVNFLDILSKQLVLKSSFWLVVIFV